MENKENTLDEILLEVLLNHRDSGKSITLSEIRHSLGYDNRTARDLIAHIASVYPVISHSGKAGYRLGREIEKLEGEELEREYSEVDKVVNDLLSRIRKIRIRLEPLMIYRGELYRKIKHIDSMDLE